MTNPNPNPYYKNFVPGDVVVLKSGSARMTIITIKDDKAAVLWSDYNSKQFCEEEFPLIALTHIP